MRGAMWVPARNGKVDRSMRQPSTDVVASAISQSKRSCRAAKPDVAANTSRRCGGRWERNDPTLGQHERAADPDDDPGAAVWRSEQRRGAMPPQGCPSPMFGVSALVTRLDERFVDPCEPPLVAARRRRLKVDHAVPLETIAAIDQASGESVLFRHPPHMVFVEIPQATDAGKVRPASLLPDVAIEAGALQPPYGGVDVAVTRVRQEKSTGPETAEVAERGTVLHRIRHQTRVSSATAATITTPIVATMPPPRQANC